MDRTQNLKPWARGVSGNPGGRPRKTPITDALREQLDKPVPDDLLGRTYAEVIAEKMAEKAAAGDIAAAREIADRAEGRSRQSIEVSKPEEENLTVDQLTERIMALLRLGTERAVDWRDSVSEREEE